MTDAERLTASVTFHGEGPFWDARTKRLLVMDVLAGAIVAIGLDGQAARHQLPMSVVTIIRRRSCGGFAIANENGLLGTDETFSEFEAIAALFDDSGLRTNDGGCDPQGGFLIGTMAYDGRTGAGTVYRVAPDHTVAEVLSPVSISNGVQWSADGERAYYVDTPTRRVDVFDVEPDSGAWRNRRTHIDLSETHGLPDGIAIDDEDGLWIALWGGGAVNRYDANGRLVETVRLPEVSQASSCAFGGTGGDELYITTSRQGLAVSAEPLAGGVFVVQTDVRGAQVGEYAG